MGHYKNNIIIINGTYYADIYWNNTILRKIVPGARVTLFREHDNPYDKNAVAVYLSDPYTALGYVPRGIAKNLAPIIDRGSNYDCSINKKHGNTNTPKISIILSTFPVKRALPPLNTGTREKPRIMFNINAPQTPTGKRFIKITDFDKWANKFEGVQGIYIIWNKQNRCYVGQSKNICQRWRQHRNKLNSCKHDNSELQNDWVQEGPDKFRFDLLIEDPDDLDKSEALYIKVLNSYFNGYNQTIDGQPIDDYGRKGKILTQSDQLEFAEIPVNSTGDNQIALPAPPRVHGPIPDIIKLKTIVHETSHIAKAYGYNGIDETSYGVVPPMTTPIKPDPPQPQKPKPDPKPIPPDEPEKSWFGMWAAILVFIGLLLAIVSGNDEHNQGVIVYEIQSGDTLSKIAKKHGVDVDAVIETNEIVNKDLVEPGMSIVIPTGK